MFIVNSLFVSDLSARILRRVSPLGRGVHSFRLTDCQRRFFTSNSRYLEVERGTQGIKDIEEKVKAYMKLSGRFHVIFTVEGYKPNPFAPVVKTAKDYGNEILDYLEEVHLGNQFLVSPHVLLIRDPLRPCLLSPTGDTFSFENV